MKYCYFLKIKLDKEAQLLYTRSVTSKFQVYKKIRPQSMKITRSWSELPWDSTDGKFPNLQVITCS